MIRVYRYRLYPTRRQVAALEDQMAFACDLYNAALEQRITAYRDHGVSVLLSDQQHDLTKVRREWPSAMNYGAQEMVLKQLNLGFDAFFRRVRRGEKPGFPRFKPRHRFNTLAWRPGKPGGAAIVNGRLRIQGVGHLKVKWHRNLPAEPRQTRITRRNGRYYVAFALEVEPTPMLATGQEVGLDLGVRQFATLSNGEVIEGPRAAHVAASSVATAQRRVARRQRGSCRRRKAAIQLARRKEREANRRRDAAHKAARSLVNRFDVIAVEDLHPPEMLQSGRWLAREISDQGWSQFLKCLEDKAESAGRRVIRVNPKNTSRRCFACGRVERRSRKGPLFRCIHCGHEADADLNAAENILDRARTEPSGAVAVLTALPEKPLAESSHVPTKAQPRDQEREGQQ